MKNFDAARHPRKKHQGALGKGDNGGHFATTERNEIFVDDASDHIAPVNALGEPLPDEIALDADTRRSIRISATSNGGNRHHGVNHAPSVLAPAHMKARHTHEVLEMLEKTGKAENPVISPEMLKTIAELPKDARRMIASNQDAPQHVLEMLAEDSDKWVRWEIASNRNTPPHALEKLSGDSDRHVRLNVARNPNTPPHVHEKLSGDSNEFVRWGAAENPRVSMEIYEKLRCDPSDMVKYAALRNPY